MKYSKEKIKQSLDCECWYDAGGTLRTALGNILKELMLEGEGFSGKHPFGNSGWEDEMAEALIILEPKIGKVIIEKYDGEEDEKYIEVTNQKLYLKTFNWLVDYIMENA